MLPVLNFGALGGGLMILCWLCLAIHGHFVLDSILFREKSTLLVKMARSEPNGTDMCQLNTLKQAVF